MREMPDIAGINDVKSIHTVGVRSIPKVLRSSYLELYLLKKETERLEKEMFLIEKKRGSLNMQLETTNKRIEKLQKEIFGGPKNKPAVNMSAKKIKSMLVNY